MKLLGRGEGAGGRDATRPLLALVVEPGEAEALRVLVRALATRVEVKALGRCPRRPDAILASSPAAARRSPRRARLAFVHGNELDVEGTMLPLPTTGLDVSAVSPRSPLVRARWRERLGLAADLVVFVDELPAAERAGALATCAAAVVSTPDLALALALGTPVVTDAPSAAALGLDRLDPADRPVLVTPIGVDAGRMAADLVADEAAAARLGRRARAYAEAELDLAAAVDQVLRLLDLAVAPQPSVGIDDRLTELHLPAVSAVRRRVADATAVLTGATQ